MGHLSNRRHCHRSNGLRQTHIKTHTRLKDPCQERLQVRYHMHLGSCLAQQIQPIRRANIPFQEASTAMLLIQRHNPSFPAMAAFHFLNRCPITGLHTTGLPTSHIMPSLRLNNNSTTMEWGTTWLGKVQITHCHLITHLPIWHIGR
jgi:hypothetical protein